MYSAITDAERDTYFGELHEIVNEKFSGIVDLLKDKYPNLSKDELRPLYFREGVLERGKCFCRTAPLSHRSDQQTMVGVLCKAAGGACIALLSTPTISIFAQMGRWVFRSVAQLLSCSVAQLLTCSPGQTIG
jgi:hypothetical protein